MWCGLRNDNDAPAARAAVPAHVMAALLLGTALGAAQTHAEFVVGLVRGILMRSLTASSQRPASYAISPRYS